MSLTVPDLDALKKRQSAKWRMHDADVLPLSIAEMDFELAPPVAAALRQAIADSDTGYAGTQPGSPRRTRASRPTPGAGWSTRPRSPRSPTSAWAPWNFATSEEILSLAIDRIAAALR